MRNLTYILFILLAMVANPASAASAAPPARSSYIVVLNDDEQSPAAAAREIADKVGGDIGFVYQHALKGFSITVPAQAIAGLRGNPKVKYVATDDIRYAFAQSESTGVQRIFAADNPAIDIDGVDDKRVDVDVAVIDTGIDLEHPDLNVAGGVNCTGSPFNNQCVSGGDDDHYHGTHVAGIIGALDNDFGVVGVAPGARLWAVKVLNSRGSGYSSWIIAGIDWITGHVTENKATFEVANMSLGGSGYSQAEYDAIQGAVNAGIAFAVAAGNSDDNALNYSPAAFNNVLTVSALADFNGLPGGGAVATCRSDLDDTLADFSNWGSAVDIAAPGVCILSTFPLEKGQYGTISGTSMASPYTAGALALLASAGNPGNAADVKALYSKLTTTGNLNWTDDSGDGIKEKLLDASTFVPTLIAGGGSNTAPAVHITSPANNASFVSGASIAFAGTASDEDVGLSDSLVWTSNLAGQIGTGSAFSTVLGNGTHTITATATDSGGLSGSSSITIIIAEAGGITLAVDAYKVKGTKYADLTWNGALSSSVDIYRSSSLLVTTANEGAYTDNELGKGSGTATYQVCESGTTPATCSNSATVSW